MSSMATSTLACVAGPPYTPGDHVIIECDGGIREGIVEEIEPTTPRPFGVSWSLMVRVDVNELRSARCDEDGHNYARGCVVRPSDHVDD